MMKVNNVDRNIKIKFNNLGSNYSHIKLNKIENNLKTETNFIYAKEDIYSKTSFNKTENTFKPKSEITPVEKDIYYDEIIYYDGGDVYGYGDS